MNWQTNSVTSRWLAIISVILLIPALAYSQSTPDCTPPDAATKSRALQVAARNAGTEPALPVIDRDAVLPGTCYWQLFVTMPHNRGHAVLSISPDRRFLVPILWDLTEDFDKEDAKLDAQLRSEADADHPPVSGPEAAPVTVVFFSDLQCPYCANFSRMLKQYEKDNPGKIRLIFRNSPLPMHKWAKPAARAGICIAAQSQDAFWQFQDFVFSRQKDTTLDSLGDLVSEFLQTAPAVHREIYLECMDTPYPESRLDKDLAEVNAYHIHSTPTLFINGRRYRGFANEEEFAAAVNANFHVGTAKQGGNAK
jgi:protein-disulfide isomerase